jgi:hypothetical protein
LSAASTLWSRLPSALVIRPIGEVLPLARVNGVSYREAIEDLFPRLIKHSSRLPLGCVPMVSVPAGQQKPVIPLPERDPAALRGAVAALDVAALAKFESDWTAATARARDEYSLMPARYFVEHWWTWVAVERWPVLAARLRECERIVAESADRVARHAAAAEIGEILQQAQTATT